MMGMLRGGKLRKDEQREDDHLLRIIYCNWKKGNLGRVLKDE